MVVGPYETEVIRNRGPWRGLEDVKFATPEWVHWYNRQRLLEPIGYLPSAEDEDEENLYRRHEHQPFEAELN